MSSNLGMMSLKLLPISTDYGEMGMQVIRQYKGASRNSVVLIKALKIKKAEDGYVVMTMRNCKQLCSKIHDKVSKNV